MPQRRKKEKFNLTPFQWRKSKVIQDADGKFKIYYPAEELFDEIGNTIGWHADGFLEEIFDNEQDAKILLIKMKKKKSR
mgnify:CR=1 FL=1